MIKLPTIQDAGDLEGKYVLLRLDLNVPVDGGHITDPSRIDKSIPTIDLLRSKKARTIIIAHSENKGDSTLHPMWDYLNGFVPLDFAKDLFSAETVKMIADMQDGGVLLLENLRNDPGEKANDPEYTKRLAAYGDVYVNDAFSVSHREHASIVGLPKLLPHYAGPLLMTEIENLSKAFSPSHPFLFILGGAKFETKLPLVNKFLQSADTIFIGGLLAGEAVKTDVVKNGKIVLPVGDIAAPDANPETLDVLAPKIAEAKFILWNGPLSYYEKGYVAGNEKLAEMIATATAHGAESIIGGGDTSAAIVDKSLLEKYSFVSTGGGAMLDFLANETLPGITALG